MENKTSIAVEQETKDRFKLEAVKQGDTYDQFLNRLLNERKRDIDG